MTDSTLPATSPAGPIRRWNLLADRISSLVGHSFLALLARYPGRVLTHRTILQAVWGPAYGTEIQYLRVFAGQIRKKLDDDPANPRLVTELGVGYRLVDRSERLE